ncbi:MAG: hypothetical protein PHQ43_05075 [Dehalococcoidales bacterium]|nr:hypothetical protein [Dehalococcoidales bacterium]
MTPTVSNETTLPSYRQLRVIQYNSTGEPAAIPAGAIAFFDDTLPTGWTRYSAQDGYYIRGENTAGTTGSQNTHDHDLTGTTSGYTGSAVGGRNAQQYGATTAHTHTLNLNTADSKSHEPTYITTILASKDSDGSPSNGMIAMWSEDADTGWENRSTSGQPFYQTFIKPAAGYGTPGGADTHNHSNMTSQQIGATSGTSSDGRTGTVASSTTHYHTLDVTSFSTESHLPPYREAVLAERNETISVSGNVYNYGTSSALSECDANSGTYELRLRAGGSTYSASCDSSTGEFTFSGISGVSAGDGLIVWIDDAEAPETDGALVIRSSGNNSVNNIFYDDAVTVTSDNTTPVDILDFDFYDYGDGETDIPYTATDGSPDTLVINSGYELLVKLKSGVANGSTVFDPGGTVTISGSDDLHVDDNAVAYLDTVTNDLNGDVVIDSGATLYIDANTTISGTSSGNITATGTLDYSTGSPDVTISIGSTISGSNLTFYDLSVTGGTTTISSATTVDNTVDIGDGATLTAGANLNIDGGALTTAGTGSVGYSSTPTVDIDGTGTVGGGSGAITFYNLDLGDTTSDTTTLGTSVTVKNDLTINTSQTFALSTYDLTVGDSAISGSGDLTVNGGTSQSASGTVNLYTATGETSNLAGSGTLTAYNLTVGDATNAMTVDNEDNDVPINASGTFTVDAQATFQASSTASFSVAGSFASSATNAVFTPNYGTVEMDASSGTHAVANDDTFYDLVINSSVTVSMASNLDINGDLTFSAGALDATATGYDINLAGNWDNDVGTSGFTYRTSIVTLDGGAGTTQTITGSTNFYDLIATTGDRILEFGAGETFTVKTGGDLQIEGDDCYNLILLRSTTFDTPFTLTFEAGGGDTLSYLDIQDSTAGNALAADYSTDSDGNSNWTIAANSCIGASTDNANATGHSFQRKVIYDDQNLAYWIFYHDGDEIEYRYSADNGDTWTPPSAGSSITYDTNDFSVTWKHDTSSENEYLYLAVIDSGNLIVRRGTLTGSSLTWDGTASTALDGDGDYSFPYLAIDTSDYLWVGARYNDGSNYAYHTATTDGSEDVFGTISSWTWSDPYQISVADSDSSVYGNIVALTLQDMYATFVVGTTIYGCLWDSSAGDWLDANSDTCVATTGGGSGDITIEQQINVIDRYYPTTSATYDPTDGSLGLVAFNGDDYDGETVYFEAVARAVNAGSANSVGRYASIDCANGPDDCKVAYYDETDTSLRFLDCDDTSCSMGTISILDGAPGCSLTGGDDCSAASGDGVTTSGEDTGQYSISLDCTNGPDDCKVAYYNTTHTALYFGDCDNGTCSEGSLELLDGYSGCSLTGGDDCSAAGGDGVTTNGDSIGSVDNLSLDCSPGADDCKIAYYNLSRMALYFADCDNATCSSGSHEYLDGGYNNMVGACALTGGDNCQSSSGGDGIASQATNAGDDPSLDCSAGGDDCKIAYLNYDNAALYFADCDNATCSSGSQQYLDGGAGGLSGCSLTGGDDCSAAGGDGVATNSQISGIYPSLDCAAGAGDCKIVYWNYDQGGIYFADCGDATCSSGSLELLDGASGCSLTGGDDCSAAGGDGVTTNTDTIGDGGFDLDCAAGGSDCKVVYYNVTRSALYFGDCVDATCSAGSSELIDGYGTNVCALTGGDNCQAAGGDEFETEADDVGNKPRLDCANGSSDCKVSYFNDTRDALYFADCDDAACSGGSSTRADSGADFAQVALVDSSGQVITAIQTSSSVYGRVRKEEPIVLADGIYSASIHTSEATNTTGYVLAARLVLVQEATPLTNTATQVEIGDYETGITSTSYVDLTHPKYYAYDQDKFSPVPETYGDIEFHATVKIADSADTVHAALVNKTSGNTVAEVSHTGDTNWDLGVATNVDADADWDTTNDDEYKVQVKCTDGGGGGCSASIANAKLVIKQDADQGISALEIPLTMINSNATDTDDTYSDIGFLIQYNPFSYTGGTFSYKLEATLNADAGTGYAQLSNDTDTDVISDPTASEITHDSSTYTRKTSADLAANTDWPTSAKNLDTQLKNSAASGNTTTVSSSWLLVGISRIGVGSVDGTQDTIAEGVDSGLATNLSAVVDPTNHYVHLTYVDSGDVYYDRYDGDWDFTASNLSVTNVTYQSLTVDTSTNDLYISYVDSDNDDVYYHKATYSAGPSWSWGSAEPVTADGAEVFTNLSANETGNARVLAIWTVDDGSPYHIGASYVLIPEHLLALFILGPVLPKLLKRKRKNRKKCPKTGLKGAITISSKRSSGSTQQRESKESGFSAGK